MDYIEKKKKIRLKNVISVTVVLLIILGLILLPVIVEKKSKESAEASILNGKVERGTISKTLSGAGTLSAEEAVKVSIPEGVDIIGYAVSDGDYVKDGDPVAFVDKVSVMAAAYSLAQSMEKIESSMQSTQNDKTDTELYSSVSGTVKAVYAEKGDDVADVILEHGCLAEIELTGGGEIKVSAVSGTVSYVGIKEGGSVYNGARMFSLTDVDSTGEYDVLVKQHQKYELMLAQLFKMQRDGYVSAESEGEIGSTDESLVIKQVGIVNATAAAANDNGTIISTTYKAGKILNDPADGKVLVSDIEEQPVECEIKDFPQAKKGDTAVVKIEVFKKEDVIQPPQYTVVYVMASQGGRQGGGMTGGFSMYGTSGDDSKEELFPTEGITVATVTPANTMKIAITIDELDILLIKEGDEALVTIDALPGRSFEGTVTGVNTGTSNDGGNSKYDAEITIERTAEMLPSMNASGIITIETKENILTIPVAAISEEGLETLVYTAYDENGKKLENPVEIKTGLSDGNKVEILAGLSEGQQFWYYYYDKVEIPGLNSANVRR